MDNRWLIVVGHYEGECSYASQDYQGGGASHLSLIPGVLPEGAGTGAVPETGEPGRKGHIGTESGKECLGLAQDGSALASAAYCMARTILTLSSTRPSPFILPYITAIEIDSRAHS
jgi:hypothetical protein